MDITAKAWQVFISRLALVNSAARDKILVYLRDHPIRSYDDRQRLIEYAYLTAIKYGEGAAALACAMYDAIAAGSAAAVPAAIPAAMPTVSEVAKAVNGTLKTGNASIVADAVGRIVKQTGVDTTMQNALRDGAEWAWIPSGDTCAFCITLASRDWQRASRDAIKNGHAEHIHANCDCTYAVRFNRDTTVEGYDPDAYKAMYKDAPLDFWNTPDGEPPPGHKSSGKNLSTKQINAMRREFYAENKAKIQEQQRIAYHDREERKRAQKALNSSTAEEIKV